MTPYDFERSAYTIICVRRLVFTPAHPSFKRLPLNNEQI